VQAAREPHSTPSIEDGDEAARAGAWSDAVAIWSRLLGGDQAEAATARLRWFLDEAAGTDSRPGIRQRTLFLVGVALGALGTACVLIGTSQDGLVRNLLATAAWVSYLLTAILAVRYARRSGHHRHATAPLDPVDLQHAVTLAARLDRDDPHA